MPTKKPVKSRGFGIGCAFIIVPEQKARVTYDNILRLADDPDVRDPIKFLRQREIVHYQRFGEAEQSMWNDNSGVADKHFYKTEVSAFHIENACLFL